MQTTNNQTMDQTVVKEVIMEQLKCYQNNFEEFQQIKKFLEPLEGKSLSRMHNQLGEMGMRLDSSGKETCIVVVASGNEHPVYNNTSKTVGLDKFDDLNSFHGRTSHEKVQQLQALLNNPEKLEKLVWIYSTMKRAYADLKEAYHAMEKDSVLNSFDNPAYGPVLEKTGVPYDVRRFTK
jgi:hypothetical protein